MINWVSSCLSFFLSASTVASCMLTAPPCTTATVVHEWFLHSLYYFLENFKFTPFLVKFTPFLRASHYMQIKLECVCQRKGVNLTKKGVNLKFSYFFVLLNFWKNICYLCPNFYNLLFWTVRFSTADCPVNLKACVYYYFIFITCLKFQN